LIAGAFQEYFAARTICEGRILLTPPWKRKSREAETYWGNAMGFRLEMDGFERAGC